MPTLADLDILDVLPEGVLAASSEKPWLEDDPG